MSALDDILKYKNTTPNINEWIMWSSQARAELQQLRAAQVALSNLLAVVHQDGGQHEQQYGAVESACAAERIVIELRADLATARSQAGMLDDYAETIRRHEIDYCALEVAHDALELRIAEQDVAIEQARELLTTLDWNDWSDRADAWIATNAQVPEESTSQQLAPGTLCACSCHLDIAPLAVTLVDGEPLCRLCSDLRYEVPPLPASEAQA